jgi:sugar phosphate isomerase/epimerase
VTRVKSRVAPSTRFGVGLRLSAQAVDALSEPREIEAFRAWLGEQGLYVFTINGFPYGPFHGTRVKEDVYLPDWLDEERLRYTDRLAAVLAEVLDEPGLEGSVSTVPGAFRSRVGDDAAVARMADLMRRHVVALHRLAERTGRTIALALEPEPACHLETVADTIAFFERHVLARAAVDDLARQLGVPAARGEEILRRHLGVCLDACHLAVEFEEPASALEALERAGIRVVKVQVSAGLSVDLDRQRDERLAALRPFAEGVYLHQVVERRPDGRLRRWTDLPDALATAAHDPAPCEWRVHFHVPVFRDRLGVFANTQDDLRALLALIRKRTPSRHLEVETYTWDVLPPEYRGEDVVGAISRELEWVAGQLGRAES